LYQDEYYEYNDGLCSAGRRPRLYLAKDGKAFKFSGENIPGVCVIVQSHYEKNGEWSNTTYKLGLVPGVRPLFFLSPIHGTWGENLGSWGEVAEVLGLPVEVAQAIIRAEYKKTAERLDKLEKFALELEGMGYTTETVVISFGSPSNRAISEGYWESPKKGATSDGREGVIAPGEGGWLNPMVIEPEGAKILSSRHSPGMHGGYYAVEVAVPVRSR